MGLTIDCARFMMAGKKAGVSFEKTLTLGRQWCAMDREELKAIWRRAGLTNENRIARDGAWADDVFHALGVSTLDVLDNSPYEGATFIQDLNRPIDTQFQDCYDVVFDGGVLEHIFNFPAAIENAMRLVKTGGHLIIHSISNNELGHGFYQFSPELYFRLLTKAHGFRIRSIVLVEMRVGGTRWYAVNDAAQLGARVCCINKNPLYILVLAQKIGAVPESLDVQQADYVQAWGEAEESTGSTPSEKTSGVPRPSWKTRLLHAMPAWMSDAAKEVYRRYVVTRLHNRVFFRRLNKDSFEVGG